jgi:hypothetical protein
MCLSDWFKQRLRVRTAESGEFAIDFEQQHRELGTVRYREGDQVFTFDAEWIGSPGYNILKVTLPPEQTNVEQTADRIIRGLEKRKILARVEQRGASVPIAADECERGLSEYIAWMRSLGIAVSVNKAAQTMTESHIPGALNKAVESLKSDPAGYVARFNDAMAYLRGYRVPFRLVAQNPRIDIRRL